MPCYSPLSAWRSDDGDILFKCPGSITPDLELPCGQCVGCRLERSRRWAMRCMHESQMHDASSFVTLTYSEDKCPLSLRYRDWQLFMKRLRKVFPKARFYMCGEYGETTQRPHYHGILFGVFFADRTLHAENGGYPLYQSAILDRLWGLGFATVGDVTFESAAYTARYIMKKVTGDAAIEHYKRVHVYTGEIVEVVPEFSRMSLKPGIGATWFEKFRSDVFHKNRDYVIVNGTKCKPPRYYREYLDRLDPDLGEEIDYNRYLRSGQGLADRTPERLAVREIVEKARVKNMSRSI